MKEAFFFVIIVGILFFMSEADGARVDSQKNYRLQLPSSIRANCGK